MFRLALIDSVELLFLICLNTTRVCAFVVLFSISTAHYGLSLTVGINCKKRENHRGMFTVFNWLYYFLFVLQYIALTMATVQ